jgi:hypothetical protein
LAVNRPKAEDDPEVLEAGDARRLFGPMAVQMLQERRSQAENLQGEIWRMFLFSMLFFLLAEGVLILPAKSVEARTRLDFPPKSPAQPAVEAGT